MHLDYWKLLRINGVQYTRKTKRIHWSTDLFDVADLEASFRFDADKCAAENKPSIVFTINSTTRLIQQLHPLSCKCRVEPDTDTLADVMLLEYWAEVVNVDRRYTSFSNESIRYSTWMFSRTSSTDINCQVLQSTSTSIRKVINNTFTMMSSKKKLCTMSHASLVSFNSTIPGVQSSLLVTSASDLPMRTIKLCSVLFGVSVDACCHKQDSLMCDGLCEKRTSTLCAINYSTVENVDDSPPFTDPKTRFWLETAIFAPARGSGQNIAIMFGVKKLEWCGYPTVKKFWRYVY